MAEPLESEDVRPENTTEPTKAILELEMRCKAAGLVVRNETDLFWGEPYPVVLIPCGKGRREIPLPTPDDVSRLLSVPFEEFTWLSGYEAVCSYSDRLIEASIRLLDRQMPVSFVWRRLLGAGVSDADIAEREVLLDLPCGERADLKLTLGRMSPHMHILTRGSRPPFRGLSVRVQGAAVTRHDDAVNLLTRLADAFLFEIEISFGIAMALEKEHNLRRGRRPAPRGKLEDIQFPRQEYDSAPIALYWYGCSATGMPLLQFLAFYQVLEFYFPTYSQAEAKRKIAIITTVRLFSS